MSETNDRAAALRARFAANPSPPLSATDDPVIQAYPTIHRAAPSAHHRYARKTYYISTVLHDRMEEEQRRLTSILGAPVAKSHLIEAFMEFGLAHMDELENRVLDRARQ